MDKTIFRIDKSIVRDKLSAYKRHAKLSVPVKSIPRADLLALVDGERYLVDTKAQLDLVLNTGINISNCFFGTSKSESDLYYAIKNGVENFIISSYKEYEIIRKNANKVSHISVMLCCNSVIGEAKARFGVTLCELDDFISEVNKWHRVDEISFHLQLAGKDATDYLNIINSLLPIADRHSIQSINLGGLTADVLEKVCEMIKGTQYIGEIVAEPGNSLFNDAVSIEASIVFVNTTRSHINLNIGIYSGLLDVALSNQKITLLLADGASDGEKVSLHVYGPSSDAVDYLGEHTFPRIPKVGEHVIIRNCGIYSLFFGTVFYPVEKIVVVE